MVAALSTLALLVALPVAATGSDRPTVVFDAAHGERFSPTEKGPLDLSGLAALLAREKATVVTASTLNAEALGAAGGLVISGPFLPLTADELTTVLAFVERGGRLAVMLHIGPPLADLLHAFDVSISNGVIHEVADVVGGDPLAFRVRRLHPDPLTRGVTGFEVYGTWALLPTAPAVSALAETGPGAWIDLDGDGKPGGAHDAKQAFAVMVAGRRGDGGFVVFGDDALFQNQFLAGQNQRLAVNLAAWLAAGRVPPVRPATPAAAR